MISREVLDSLPPHTAGPHSFLTDAEWENVRETLARGVTVEQIYPLVADKYKSAKSFRRAVENRLGIMAQLRGPWKPGRDN